MRESNEESHVSTHPLAADPPTAETLTPIDKVLTKDFSRRNFLKGIRNLMAGAAAPQLAQFVLPRQEIPDPGLATAATIPETTISPEILPDRPRNVLVIDFPTDPAEYQQLEQQLFSDQPDRYIPRSELISKLEASNEYYRQENHQLTPTSFDDPWPELLFDITSLGYPEQAALYQFLNKYHHHGSSVTEAAQTSWEVLRQSGQTELFSLSHFLRPGTVDFRQDEWGNTGVVVQLTAADIIPQLQTYLETHQEFMHEGVVNMSLQLGEVQSWIAGTPPEIATPHRPTVTPFENPLGGDSLRIITTIAEKETVFNQNFQFVEQDTTGAYIFEYRDPDDPNNVKYFKGFDNTDNNERLNQGLIEATASYQEQFPHEASNPGTREIGSYTGEQRLAHIQEMVTLATAFPDLVFCMAAGNNRDDLRGLAEAGIEVPPNLIIVGQWSTAWNPPRPLADVHGAEFYLPNRIPGELLDGEDQRDVVFADGSSFATPQLAALIGVMRGQGIPINELKTKLWEFVVPSEYPINKNDPAGETATAQVVSLELAQETYGGKG